MIGRFILLGASASLMMASAALAQDGAGPTDAQIAHIAYTAGQLDLSAGEQALAKSGNDAVRAFAQTMVRDHKAVNDQALALVKKLGVAPEDNATSKALAKAAGEKSRELGALTGSDFDRAYVGGPPRHWSGARRASGDGAHRRHRQDAIRPASEGRSRR